MPDENSAQTDLNDIIDRDIETIVALRMNAERDVNRHQRYIERITNTLGRPFAVYLILLFCLLWMIMSFICRFLGLPVIDRPPFPWLEDVVSISSLVMTVVVLTTQNRQARLAEQRRHLDLQITLLTERKVSKVIELLETMRHDLPQLQNDHDPEAVAMKEPVDPHSALNSLTQTMREAAREHEQNLEGW